MDYILLICLVFIYMFPWVVAKVRRHKSSLAIFVMALLLGWTVIFWIYALIWACTSNVKEK